MKRILVCFLVLTSFTMTGCPDPTIKEFFYGHHVAKISFMKNGKCKLPYYFEFLTTYTSSPANQTLVLYLARGGGRAAISSVQDHYFVDEDTCSLYVSHNPIERYPGEINNLVPEYVPIEIHALEICALTEFHYSGNIQTTDIREIYACQRILDGWREGEGHFVDSCLQQIPIALAAETTDATSDHDWPDYNKTISYLRNKCQ